MEVYGVGRFMYMQFEDTPACQNSSTGFQFPPSFNDGVVLCEAEEGHAPPGINVPKDDNIPASATLMPSCKAAWERVKSGQPDVIPSREWIERQSSHE